MESTTSSSDHVLMVVELKIAREQKKRSLRVEPMLFLTEEMGEFNVTIQELKSSPAKFSLVLQSVRQTI